MSNASPQTRSAKPTRPLLIAILVSMLFVLLGYAGYRWMKSDALATLVEFSGGPQRDTAAALEQWRDAKLGDAFGDGDGAKTPEASLAHFRLLGGAKLKLEPSSTIRFKRTVGGRDNLRVDVEVGEANVKSGSAGITIESEFGSIVLDANSAIRMSRSGAQLDVDVELGSIQINDRAVTAGEGVSLEIGGIVIDEPEPVEPQAEPEAEPEPEPELDLGDGVTQADLVVEAGDNFAVHDPSPPTAIGFSLQGVCDGPARLTSGDQKTEAQGQANLRFGPGQHAYQVRCLSEPDKVAAEGTLRVLQDAGTKKLPTFTPTASVATDGRRYTVLYQHKLPTVTVSWPTAPQADSYTLQIGKRSIQTQTPNYTLAALPRGRHTVVFSAASTPVRQSRSTTIEVVYDTQAPAARVSDPPLAFDPDESVTISGQALPGWNVSVGDRQLEVDPQNKFTADIEGAGTIPIAFTHPSRGTHYYLRRPKPKP